MNCPICKNNDFLSLDKLRDEKGEGKGFCICKSCGFQTYHETTRKHKTEEAMLDYYRYEYRRHPSSDNIITCNRKLGYVQIFLSDILLEKEGDKLKPKKIMDVGCATGYTLAWLNSMGHDKDNLYGTEFTKSFSNFAKNFYGLKHIYEEIPEGIEFDYIHLMHVFEHMYEPDKKLTHYRKILKDDGYLFLGVPIWHDYAFDTALRTSPSFEDLYNPNHHNVWNKALFKQFVMSNGFELVKEDDRFYGYFSLWKKGPKTSLLKQDYNLIIDSTIRQKEAFLYLHDKKFLDALKRFPNFPDAIVGHAFFDLKDDYEKANQVLTQGLERIPQILDLRLHRANLNWQWKQYQKSIDDLEVIMKFRPNDEISWELMGRTYAEMGDFEKAKIMFMRSAQLNPGRWPYAMDMIGNMMARDKDKPIKEIRDPWNNKGKNGSMFNFVK